MLLATAAARQWKSQPCRVPRRSRPGDPPQQPTTAPTASWWPPPHDASARAPTPTELSKTEGLPDLLGKPASAWTPPPDQRQRQSSASTPARHAGGRGKRAAPGQGADQGRRQQGQNQRACSKVITIPHGVAVPRATGPERGHATLSAIDAGPGRGQAGLGREVSGAAHADSAADRRHPRWTPAASGRRRQRRSR